MFMYGNKQPAAVITIPLPPSPRQKQKPISRATSAHFNLIKNYFTDAKYF